MDKRSPYRQWRPYGIVAPIMLGILGICGLLWPEMGGAAGHPRQAPPLESHESTETRVNKAKQMREAWKSWAIKHKGTLQTMLHPANGKEKEALDRAYGELPAHLTEYGDTGIRFQDLNSGGTAYTWQPLGRLHSRPDPNNPRAQQGADKEQIGIGKRLNAQYEKYHDIEISRSINGGPAFVTLWASGRITVTTRKMVAGAKGSKVMEEIKEVAPPYKELLL